MDSSNNLYAGADGGVFKTTDGGITWRQVGLYFTISRKKEEMKNIFRLVRCGGFLFVVFDLFTSTNSLHTQGIQSNGPYGSYVATYAVSGTDLLAGTLGGVA